MEQPRTLMEAIRFFADADRTLETAVALRWPQGIHCPACGRTDVRFLATRRIEALGKRLFAVTPEQYAAEEARQKAAKAKPNST